MDTDTTTRDRDICERLRALANVLGGHEARICEEAIEIINDLRTQPYLDFSTRTTKGESR